MCRYILNHTRQQMLPGHYRPSSETPFKWRFAGGPIVTRECMLVKANAPR